ncbi:MAG: 4,5-DOPA dioxygenase extradiol [Sterolibacterium sp.]|nr:4,5-DOPA dioxygenase extradiol [Sterolibacterium sp.]
METPRLPALFIGHGSPMNTLEHNLYTRAWRSIGQALVRPKSILAISAHWYVPGLAVTAMETPQTIHDFGGFPQSLFEYQYPAPGSPALALRVQELLKPLDVAMDHSWGLDHGTWSVLAHLFPQADIPVVQLSIDRTQPNSFQYELGQRLSPLRDEGVLIVGSGNVVHNLAAIKWDASALPHDWARRFEQQVKDRLLRHDHAALIDYLQLDREARLAVPTPEHYLPLLAIIGTQYKEEALSFPVEGISMGSLSMLALSVGF